MDAPLRRIAWVTLSSNRGVAASANVVGLLPTMWKTVENPAARCPAQGPLSSTLLAKILVDLRVVLACLRQPWSNLATSSTAQ